MLTTSSDLRRHLIAIASCNLLSPVSHELIAGRMQQVWPPGSADTVSPRLPLMTQVQHFVSRIKKRQRRDRRCQLVTLTFNFETGAQCSTCRGVPFCRFWWYYDFVVDLCVIGRGRASVAGARRHRYRSIRQQQLLRNWQITVFRRQNSRFKMRLSKIGLNYNVGSIIRILRASLVKIDMEMAEKYTNQGSR